MIVMNYIDLLIHKLVHHPGLHFVFVYCSDMYNTQVKRLFIYRFWVAESVIASNVY